MTTFWLSVVCVDISIWYLGRTRQRRRGLCKERWARLVCVRGLQASGFRIKDTGWQDAGWRRHSRMWHVCDLGAMSYVRVNIISNWWPLGAGRQVASGKWEVASGTAIVGNCGIVGELLRTQCINLFKWVGSLIRLCGAAKQVGLFRFRCKGFPRYKLLMMLLPLPTPGRQSCFAALPEK